MFFELWPWICENCRGCPMLDVGCFSNRRSIFDGIFALIIKPWFSWVFWICRGLWYSFISYRYYCFINLQNWIGGISDHFSPFWINSNSTYVLYNTNIHFHEWVAQLLKWIKMIYFKIRFGRINNKDHWFSKPLSAIFQLQNAYNGSQLYW